MFHNKLKKSKLSCYLTCLGCCNFLLNPPILIWFIHRWIKCWSACEMVEFQYRNQCLTTKSVTKHIQEYAVRDTPQMITAVMERLWSNGTVMHTLFFHWIFSYWCHLTKIKPNQEHLIEEVFEYARVWLIETILSEYFPWRANSSVIMTHTYTHIQKK